MPKIQKKCRCQKKFLVYPYRKNNAKFCSRKCTGRFKFHKKGYKCQKGSLSKMGYKNPMYGKKFTELHRKKISLALQDYFSKNPIHPFKIGFKKNKNPNWKGDKISSAGVHDWIKKIKGTANIHLCRFKNETCKGRLEWSNKSQKYLRRIYDWQVLCLSHHRRYDKHTHLNGLTTRFKKGNLPWNKKK